MKKILVLLATIALTIPVLVGCGGGGGGSHYDGGSSYAMYAFLQQQQQQNNNNNNQADSSDSSTPDLMTKNSIIVSSGVYSESIFSVVGSGFGYTQQLGDVTLTVESGEVPNSLTYSIQKWNNDSINIKLDGLSQEFTSTLSMKIKTNAGTEIAGPNIEIKPMAIDNNIGNKAYGIFVGSPRTSIGQYCVKDAEDVKKALVGNSCFNWQQSELLTTESDASHAMVTSLLEIMASKMDDNSTFIFYYSGHGASNYLQVTDGLTASELETYLKKMPEKSHKILLIDACSSGSFLPKNLKKSSKTFKSLAGSIKNLAVISASGPENNSQVSMKLNQSEMTYALLEALGRNSNNVGISYTFSGLTLSELYNYMAIQNFYTDLDDEHGTQIIFPTFRKTGNDFYIKK